MPFLRAAQQLLSSTREALRASKTGTSASPGGLETERVAALRRQVKQLRENIVALRPAVEEIQGAADRLLEEARRRVDERAALVGMPSARLLSTAIQLEGKPTERNRVNRLSVGDPVEQPFSRWMGINRIATEAADVRELWTRLLALESECEDVLRGAPSTVLDVPDASVSLTGEALRITMSSAGAGAKAVAVPKFTFDGTTRKLNNFGHWLIDCLPQVAALATVAPDASLLVPASLRGFHYSTLALLGIERQQLIEWDGSPLASDRLLAFESAGRQGGGRPLSALMELRRRFASGVRGTRRLYFSRRDAKAARRWVVNEPAVEELFKARGFEIVTVAAFPLRDMIRLFSEARVVAGINGAGLAHVLFSPGGTHVIPLFSDSLIRWHAHEEGTRSLWAKHRQAAIRRLSALGDSPRVYAHVAAAFEQYCHSFVGSDEMPLDPLAGFLDDVLATVEQTEPVT